MPIINAYQCPVTKKLFNISSRTKYINHIKKIRNKRNELRRDAIFAANFEKWYESQYTTLDSIAAIEQWAMVNIQKFIKYYYRDYPHSLAENKDTEIIDLKLDVNFKPICSNSHCRPRDGVENWHRLPDSPTWYPGWFGSITYYYKGRWPTDILVKMGIHSGSGGGGAMKNGYSSIRQTVTLFASDWPALFEAQQKQMLINTLANTNHALG